MEIKPRPSFGMKPGTGIFEKFSFGKEKFGTGGQLALKLSVSNWITQTWNWHGV
jgi:hypothetical protein